MNEFSPFAIPNHSSLISMSMQSLKKIGQKLLNLESRNKALMDRLMDEQIDRQTLKIFKAYNIPPLFVRRGIKIHTCLHDRKRNIT